MFQSKTVDFQVILWTNRQIVEERTLHGRSEEHGKHSARILGLYSDRLSYLFCFLVSAVHHQQAKIQKFNDFLKSEVTRNKWTNVHAKCTEREAHDLKLKSRRWIWTPLTLNWILLRKCNENKTNQHHCLIESSLFSTQDDHTLTIEWRFIQHANFRYDLA